MFKRKKTDDDEAPAPETPVEEIVERTTCYPQDGGAPPRVAGEPRTTVYRQALPWTRRGYETIN
jgi:hypothetical protein